MIKVLLGIILIAGSTTGYADEEKNTETPWYESLMNEAKVMAQEAQNWCSQYFDEGVDFVKSKAAEFDNPLQLAEDARKKLEERNLAAEKTMKDLQQKTGFKGETTNLEKVINSGEVKYETKDISEIKEQ